MPPRSRLTLMRALIPVGLLALLSACVPTSTTTTTTPPPSYNCGFTPMAWVEPATGSGTPQVWAIPDCGGPRQITHLRATELSNDGCPTIRLLGYPMLAPDLRHILVGVDCTPPGSAGTAGVLLVVDVATGRYERAAPGGRAAAPTVAGDTTRTYGWVDDSHVVGLSVEGAFEHTLNGASTELLGPDVVDLVVRGNTLFYQNPEIAGHRDTTIRTYDLTSQADQTVAIQSSVTMPNNLPPAYYPTGGHLQGWDVSPDGLHIAYEVTAPATAPASVSTSRIYYADANGQNATRIASYTGTDRPVKLRFSPDGKRIAITESEPVPDAIVACVNTAGHRGDPCLEFYSSDVYDYPAWTIDGASFYATAVPSATGSYSAGLYQFKINGSSTGTLFRPNAYHVWSVLPYVANQADVCAQILPSAAAASAPGGFGGLSFPAGAVMTPPLASFGATGQFTLRDTDVCYQGTVAQVNGGASTSVFAQLLGAAWGHNPTYPYGGDVQATCVSGGTCFKASPTANPEHYLSFEGLGAWGSGTGYVVYHLRLATPPAAPSCDPHWFNSSVPYIYGEVPPLTKSSSAATFGGAGGGHHPGPLMCSAGTQASILTFLQAHSGGTPRHVTANSFDICLPAGGGFYYADTYLVGGGGYPNGYANEWYVDMSIPVFTAPTC